jgi:hypothetical protein
MLRNMGGEGLSPVANGVCSGSNSGYQILDLSIQALGRDGRIILLGYDMRHVNGKSNWHGGHPVETKEAWYTNVYSLFFNNLRVPQGVQILNATPGSALKCFKRVELESVLPNPA